MQLSEFAVLKQALNRRNGRHSVAEHANLQSAADQNHVTAVKYVKTSNYAHLTSVSIKETASVSNEIANFSDVIPPTKKRTDKPRLCTK